MVEKLWQLFKDHRACYAQGLENERNRSDYLKKREELKWKIREKRKICREEFMANVNNNYRNNIKPFWKFVNGSIKFNAKKKIEMLTDGSGNSFSSCAGKVNILKSHYMKLGSELDVQSFDDSWKV